jgi:phosphoserine phosphatase RsbU/P
MRALVADDDRSTAVRLTRTLAHWGLDVTTVHDGTAAWEALRADSTIVLAILDWMMPGVDGPELCQRIRRDEARAHMYVLLLTARDSRADLVVGLDAGADDYLVKPFDSEEFRARVQVGRRVLRLQERLVERVAELEAAASKIKQLHGLLPICSYCKKVHTDTNYWQQVEHYVAQHSEVQFSHGICPSCYDGVIAQLDN